MKKEDKPFLTAEQQIQHLASKGVKFEIMDQAAAEKYLKQNNNYFKLRAFRKNYPKHTVGENAGKYIKLDFAMLCDLATIDMHLRYVLLQIALNTEHFLKVKILRKMEEYGEDGYAVVDDFFNHLKSEDSANKTRFYDRLCYELERNQGNPYCGGLIKACSGGLGVWEFSVWAFIEVIPLGTLLHFYKYCANRFSDSDMVNDYYLMNTARELRNAAAHNNCIINDLQTQDNQFSADGRMKSLLNQSGLLPRKTIVSRFKNARVQQICTLLYAHTKLASKSANAHVRELLDGLMERIARHSDYYSSNPLLVGNYSFFVKIVDIFYSKN